MKLRYIQNTTEYTAIINNNNNTDINKLTNHNISDNYNYQRINTKQHSVRQRNDNKQCMQKHDDNNNMVIHDLFITILISMINVLIDFMMFFFNVVYCILLKLYEYIINNKIIMHIINIFIGLMILPIVDALYPIFDIEKKFDQIVCCGETELTFGEINTIDKEEIEIDYDIELTQNIWLNYIRHLKTSDKNNYDLFDTLINQKLTQINSTIINSINKSDAKPKYITFRTFYTILSVSLGDAVNIKYRNTSNKLLFVSIFGDDSPYRRFKYNDTI